MSLNIWHKQARRFAVSGALATALHIIITVFLIELFNLAPAMANGVAFASATIFSYTINTLWSFSSQLHGNTLFRFIAVSIAGSFIVVLVSGIVDYYKMHYLIGIAGVVCTVPPITFTLHRHWTYKLV